MSYNSQSVNPQDLVGIIIDLQRRFENLAADVRGSRVQIQYEEARTKIADAKSALMALVSVFDKYNDS